MFIFDLPKLCYKIKTTEIIKMYICQIQRIVQPVTVWLHFFKRFQQHAFRIVVIINLHVTMMASHC